MLGCPLKALGNGAKAGKRIIKHYVSLFAPSGPAEARRTKTLLVTEEDAALYREDPELFAANYFGLSKKEYREWIKSDGSALCGARSRSGRMCGNSIGGWKLTVEEWKSLHRKGCCNRHEKDRLSKRARRWPFGSMLRAFG